jgi:hypothetical protein
VRRQQPPVEQDARVGDPARPQGVRLRPAQRQPRIEQWLVGEALQ